MVKVEKITDAGAYAPIEHNLHRFLENIQSKGCEVLRIDQVPYKSERIFPFYYVVIYKEQEQKPRIEYLTRQHHDELTKLGKALNSLKKSSLCTPEDKKLIKTIKNIVSEWEKDSWTDGFSDECMIKIRDAVKEAESEGEE